MEVREADEGKMDKSISNHDDDMMQASSSEMKPTTTARTTSPILDASATMLLQNADEIDVAAYRNFTTSLTKEGEAHAGEEMEAPFYPRRRTGGRRSVNRMLHANFNGSTDGYDMLDNDDGDDDQNTKFFESDDDDEDEGMMYPTLTNPTKSQTRRMTSNVHYKRGANKSVASSEGLMSEVDLMTVGMDHVSLDNPKAAAGGTDPNLSTPSRSVNQPMSGGPSSSSSSTRLDTVAITPVNLFRPTQQGLSSMMMMQNHQNEMDRIELPLGSVIGGSGSSSSSFVATTLNYDSIVSPLDPWASPLHTNNNSNNNKPSASMMQQLLLPPPLEEEDDDEGGSIPSSSNDGSRSRTSSSSAAASAKLLLRIPPPPLKSSSSSSSNNNINHPNRSPPTTATVSNTTTTTTPKRKNNAGIIMEGE